MWAQLGAGCKSHMRIMGYFFSYLHEIKLLDYNGSWDQLNIDIYLPALTCLLVTSPFYSLSTSEHSPGAYASLP